MRVASPPCAAQRNLVSHAMLRQNGRSKPMTLCRVNDDAMRRKSASTGRARLVFPVALNDEAGDWKVRVTEPLTGVTAERALSVR